MKKPKICAFCEGGMYPNEKILFNKEGFNISITKNIPNDLESDLEKVIMDFMNSSFSLFGKFEQDMGTSIKKIFCYKTGLVLNYKIYSKRSSNCKNNSYYLSVSYNNISYSKLKDIIPLFKELENTTKIIILKAKIAQKESQLKELMNPTKQHV